MSTTSSTTTTTTLPRRVIDTHLHVWADSNEVITYPYAVGQTPPESLQNKASYTELISNYIDQNNNNVVVGALIVQPINHKFDHSYVLQAIRTHPTKLKGMLLHDPSLSTPDAVSRLEELVLQGFVGVRYNPYLWPKAGDGWEPMSVGTGLEIYKRCAELHIPVGIMCFQGISKHYTDIVQLLTRSPETIMILDHFAFTSLPKSDTDIERSNNEFNQLLSLVKYPNVYVKISALFRLNDIYPFDRVHKERFIPLLEAFGSDRLLYGSDFPFVIEQSAEQYILNQELVTSWIPNETDRSNILSGTAEKLFGPWGTPIIIPPPASEN